MDEMLILWGGWATAVVTFIGAASTIALSNAKIKTLNYELAQKKNMKPALDGGVIEISSTKLEGNAVLLQIDIFEVPSQPKLGAVNIRRGVETEFGKPKYSHAPLHEAKSFVFEPNSESKIQEVFTLESSQPIFIRWKIYRKNNEGKMLSRTRYAAYDFVERKITHIEKDKDEG